jgi:hypothetical protein
MTGKRIRQPITQTRTTSTPINLPTYWSPEQAAAVFEFLDELRERVLSHYGVEIQEFLQEDRVTATPFTPSDIDENDVPF